MKKIIFFVLVLVVFFISALIFDWGRKHNSIIIDNNSLIMIDYPSEGQEVASPFEIRGVAKGLWFFEGSFPIELIDTDGKVISRSIATSTSDWMTEDFIGFRSEMYFDRPTSTRNAILVLKRDNPSGNSEYDQSVFIPVTFK